MGMFMKRYPHFFILEVYHQKKKGTFSKELVRELVGYTELSTEDLISCNEFGKEFYLFLEDSVNLSSIIKLRTLFVPS